MTQYEQDALDSFDTKDQIIIEHCTDEVYWYGYDLTFDKSYKKCINQLERVVRASLEYDLWAKNCKQNDPDAIRCPICGDNYYEKSSKCDTHHHPRTLYCIVDDEIAEMVDKNEMKSTTASEIVRRVLKKHMQNQVSFINICTHCHKKYHDGNPDVSTKMYNIFEDKINAHKNSISKKLSTEVPIYQQSTSQNIVAPKLIFVPAPLPQSIDDGNFEITKFKKS